VTVTKLFRLFFPYCYFAGCSSVCFGTQNIILLKCSTVAVELLIAEELLADTQLTAAELLTEDVATADATNQPCHVQ